MANEGPLSFAYGLAPGQRVHIVGIGGAGMSALARVLIGRGVPVSGSDQQAGPASQALADLGATVSVGHRAEQVAGASLVLISSAVQPDNPEVLAAAAAGIPVLKRREALPYVLGDRMQIAVAGTHGKTTTTAMIVHMLRETGRDPSYIVGGVLANTGDNAHAGRGEAFVIEADEYDYMFLGLTPTIAVLTNVEHDHPDMFPTLDSTVNAFRQFIARIPEYDGLLVACADDPMAAALAYERRAGGQPTVTYGITGVHHPVWRAEPGSIVAGKTYTDFTVIGVQNGEPVQQAVRIALAGAHNVQNALAALAAAVTAGVPLVEAVGALASFRGTGRRFELMGEARGVTVISDYAHHPTAIRANLAAARARFPEAAIWAVWQPHTFSRTRTLAADFAAAFADADHALVTDIYAARERAAEGDPTGASMAAQIAAAGHPDARHSGDLARTSAILRAEAKPGDVVLIFSAGDAPQIGEQFLQP